MEIWVAGMKIQETLETGAPGIIAYIPIGDRARSALGAFAARSPVTYESLILASKSAIGLSRGICEVSSYFTRPRNDSIKFNTQSRHILFSWCLADVWVQPSTLPSTGQSIWKSISQTVSLIMQHLACSPRTLNTNDLTSFDSKAAPSAA